MRDAHSNDPNNPRYWPVRLPDPEAVELALWMMFGDEDGRGGGYATYRQVEDATGLTTNRIKAIKNDPWYWYPFIDDVAVERALAGDPDIMPRLTVFERAQVRERLIERMEREPFDVYKHGYGWDREPFWIIELGEKWGVSGRNLAAMVNKAVLARRRAMAA